MFVMYTDVGLIQAVLFNLAKCTNGPFIKACFFGVRFHSEAKNVQLWIELESNFKLDSF